MLNENIKAVRKSKGLSQEELAIRLNVVRQTISKWERGLSVPDSEMLIAISDVLETPVNVLLGETVAENVPDDIKVISRITSGVKMISLDKGVKVAKIAKVREKISDGDRDIDMEEIDDVVINIAKSDEPVVVIHDEVDVDDDEEDTRFDGIEDE